MNVFRTIIIASFLSLISYVCTAQNNVRTITLKGSVMDSFLEVGVPGAKVYLFDNIGNVVDSTIVKERRNNGKMLDTWYSFIVPAQKKRYTIKAVREGYSSGSATIELKMVSRLQNLSVADIMMKKKKHGNMVDGEHMLEELTVKATRIKMFFRGDTLVYNADAFNMPEGSMLDNLIKQMPGASINDKGEIFINGRKIDYLTLNGKRMLEGGTRALVHNLPYYSINKLKVYEKSKDDDIAMGRTSIDKEYVMDVNLKNIYQNSNFGNVEAGIGTDNRWKVNALDMLTRDFFTGMAFGDLNNVNQDNAPGVKGDEKMVSPRHDFTTHQFGIQGSFERKHSSIKDMFGVTGSWKKTESDMVKNTQSLFSGNNIVKDMAEKGETKDNMFNFGNKLIYQRSSFIYLNTYITYLKTKRIVTTSRTTSDNSISTRSITNNSIYGLTGNMDTWRVNNEFSLRKKTAWGDNY